MRIKGCFSFGSRVGRPGRGEGVGDPFKIYKGGGGLANGSVVMWKNEDTPPPLFFPSAPARTQLPLSHRVREPRERHLGDGKKPRK